MRPKRNTVLIAASMCCAALAWAITLYAGTGSLSRRAAPRPPVLPSPARFVAERDAAQDPADGPTGSISEDQPGEPASVADAGMRDEFSSLVFDRISELGDQPHPFPQDLFDTLMFVFADFEYKQFSTTERSTAISMLGFEYANTDDPERKASIKHALLDASNDPHWRNRWASILAWADTPLSPDDPLAEAVTRLRDDPEDRVAYLANSVMLRNENQ